MSKPNKSVFDWISGLSSFSTIEDKWHYALIEANLSTINEHTNFHIPMFIIGEELRKEEEGQESIILRELYVHLLQLINKDTTVRRFDYSDSIRDSVRFKQGIPNPLSTDKMHTLSTDIKLYIINKMIHLAVKQLATDVSGQIGYDTSDNDYFLTANGFLCIRYGKDMQDRIEKSLQPPSSKLEGEIRRKKKWKVLARNVEEWKMIVSGLVSHGEITIASYLHANIEEAETMMITEEKRNEIRNMFNHHLNRLLRPPTKKRAVLASQPDRPDTDAESNYIGERSNRDYVESEEEKEYARSNRLKCASYPHCEKRKEGNCNYTHPVWICKLFGKKNGCENGFDCLLIHPICPEDESCKKIDCAYHHVKSKPVLLRRLADVPGRGALRLRWDDKPRFHYRPPNLKHVKCPNFAKCKNKSCPFKHPDPKDVAPRELQDKCRMYPNCVRGRDCLYLHELCPKDGLCMKSDCVLDHTRQPHPRMQYETEENFLTSAIKDKSRKRAKHARGLLRTEIETNKVRCEFYPRPCENLHCKKWRPIYECHFLDKGECKYGGSSSCPLIHPMCMFDEECTSITCQYEHIKSESVLIKIMKTSNYRMLREYSENLGNGESIRL